MTPRKNKPKSSPTRVKQPSKTRSRRRVVDPDDLDDLDDDTTAAISVDENDDAISQDTALTLFFRRPPAIADHVVVIAITPQGEQIVQDRSAQEARREPATLANAVLDACSRWAAAEGRQTRFRCLWQAGDRVVASHQIVCGDGDPTALDGTVDSFLAQQQRHQETQTRLHHEGFAMVQDAWRSMLSGAMKRIEALERDNEQLRDRLKKAGDVDAEVTYSTVAAEIEQRQRLTEIMESRLMPIAQALLAKQLGLTTQPSAADIQSLIKLASEHAAPPAETTAS